MEEEVAVIAQHYFAYESRLASFRMVHKKRASTAGPRGKTHTLTWPHKTIAPADLAKAGFFFHPLTSHPDQVMCFLCHKALDGWEPGDNPVHEHLAHAPECGWARLVAVETDAQGLGQSDPMSVDMLEARKMTFAGRWPHEGKKGWKCKAKQLVEAGWHYTPSVESADMAMCAYCSLVLDGWEAGDKPLDEHYNRSSNCPFFTLAARNQGGKKLTARGKAATVAKNSRLSVQSTSVISDGASALDVTASAEDSVLTETSVNPGSRKTSRTRKAPAKGRKTRAKRDEEAEEALHDSDRDRTASPPPQLAAPKTTGGRGRKRGSEAVEESIAAVAEAPAAKKRATRAHGSVVDSGALVPQAEVSVLEKPGRGRKGAKGKRIVSDASTVSRTSLHGLPGAFPTDQSDVNQAGDVEMNDDGEENGNDDGDLVVERQTAIESDTPRNKSAYAMFDSTPAHFDESALDEELRELQEIMRAEARASAVHQGDEDTEVEDVDADADSDGDDGKEPVVEQAPLYVPKSRKSGSGVQRISTGSMVLDDPPRRSLGRAQEGGERFEGEMEGVEEAEEAEEEEEEEAGQRELETLRHDMSRHSVIADGVSRHGFAEQSDAETEVGQDEPTNPERLEERLEELLEGRPEELLENEQNTEPERRDHRLSRASTQTSGATARKRGRPSKKSKSDVPRIQEQPGAPVDQPEEEGPEEHPEENAPEPPAETEPDVEMEQPAEPDAEHEQPDPNTSFASAASTDTVIKATRKRGRPSKKSRSDASMVVAEQPAPLAEQPQEPRKRGRPSKKSKSGVAEVIQEQQPASHPVEEAELEERQELEEPKGPQESDELDESSGKWADSEPAEREASNPLEPDVDMNDDDDDIQIYADASTHGSSRAEASDLDDDEPETQSTPATTWPRGQSSSGAPSTPEKSRSSLAAASTHQTVPSTSHTPRSPDSENAGPSSHTPPTTTRRIDMAPPAATTPQRAASPLKNAIIPAGRVRTEGTPWKEMDVETVFDAFEEDMGREAGEGALWAGDELGADECEMTVEQWILSNAAAAEARMRDECEAMVGRLESEGARALRVLEGLVVDQ